MTPRKASGISRSRKNMDMDASKLARAQRLLGAATETETVDMALDYVIFQSEVFGALDRLAALGGLADPFGQSYSTAEARPRRVAERKARG
jgi:hypothetical protein